jgi:multiple sugar transport system ATP-binding protein
MATVEFDRVSRRFADTDHPAVDSLELAIGDGEFLVLVGPSGCGKSTTLRMLAGLESVDAGRILIGGTDVTDADPKQRDIAMVFQNYALYPHMTVAQNMGFALKTARRPRAEIRERVAEAARMLDLEPLLGRKPKDLSGGQRQRVAMGRAIIRHPQVFLMDEPLSNLDAALRVQTRNQIAALQRRLGTTTVYVTHDQAEAMTMGDRVAVLRDGVLQQCAPPRELYRDPANVFVAGFLGTPPMNLFELPVHGDSVTLGGWMIRLPRTVAAAGPRIVVGIRPEHLRLHTDAGIQVEVGLVEDLGADAYLYGRVGGNEPVVARCDPRDPPPRGSRVQLVAEPEDLRFFDAGGHRLR